MPVRGEPLGTDRFEHLRKGTREQYESAWTYVKASSATTFMHELGEVPWLVDVLVSPSADGREPAVATVTVTKTDSVISVTSTAAGYFQVRAM